VITELPAHDFHTLLCQRNQDAPVARATGHGVASREFGRLVRLAVDGVRLPLVEQRREEGVWDTSWGTPVALVDHSQRGWLSSTNTPLDGDAISAIQISHSVNEEMDRNGSPSWKYTLMSPREGLRAPRGDLVAGRVSTSDREIE
jgi:hypothetical protein